MFRACGGVGGGREGGGFLEIVRKGGGGRGEGGPEGREGRGGGRGGGEEGGEVETKD